VEAPVLSQGALSGQNWSTAQFSRSGLAVPCQLLTPFLLHIFYQQVPVKETYMKEQYVGTQTRHNLRTSDSFLLVLLIIFPFLNQHLIEVNSIFLYVDTTR
jgi:hypothetical protein